ncbi:MAG: hypothetical protein HIU93_00245 [Acidobacteria bacterium]|nr:hypothetical protein [Acidobacteriota bacterium]MBW4044273.1 hypothetical protein [Acidobacteriota bacterium]
MRKFSTFMLAAAALTLVSGRGVAQQPENTKVAAPTHYYKLTYSVEEFGENGKITNSRTYSTAIAAGSTTPGTVGNAMFNSAQIRTGSKIPVTTSSKGDIQYMDVGVNLDANHAQETGGKLALEVSADISSITPSPATSSSAAPIIRQNRWGFARVVVPIDKPTVILSSDNLDNRGKLQIELTATRMD